MRDDANARRKKPANRYGCKPIEDVCVEHDMPLICRHGCVDAKAEILPPIVEHSCETSIETRKAMRHGR